MPKCICLYLNKKHNSISEYWDNCRSQSLMFMFSVQVKYNYIYPKCLVSSIWYRLSEKLAKFLLVLKMNCKHTLNELWTNVSSRSMTIHFLCISWCLTGGNNGRGACSAITRRGGEALPSMLFAPLLPGGPLPRPPRQQHSRDRKNPPPPLDFLVPSGAVPDTGVTSPSLCCPPGDGPKTTIAHQNTSTHKHTRGSPNRYHKWDPKKRGVLKVAVNVIASTRSNCLPQSTRTRNETEEYKTSTNPLI